MYQCYQCSYNTNVKCNLTRHLNKKKNCGENTTGNVAKSSSNVAKSPSNVAKSSSNVAKSPSNVAMQYRFVKNTAIHMSG